MAISDPLFVLPSLLALGFLAQWLASLLRIPAIVFLLALGITLGPVLGVLDPTELLGELLPALVALSVGVILFEGGLSLRLSEARRLGGPLWALVLGGLVLTSTSAAGLAHWLAGLSWGTSCVLGAVLVVTGPTVIKPMLRQARLQRRPAQLLKWESIVNDPFGALLAVVALEVSLALSPDSPAHRSFATLPLLILAAGGCGALAGWLLGRGLDRGHIPEHLKVPGVVAAVLAVFAGGEALYHEAGLLSVTAMGVVLANVASPSVESIRHFKEDVATILVALLFLVLSANLSLEHLRAMTLGAGLFVAAVLFVVRPVTVWLSLAGSDLPWREKLFIGWIAPRGIVAAAMAGALEPRLLEAGYEDARLLVPILFSVVIATVVLHGLSVSPLARALGIAAKGRGGLLLVGADSWALDLAQTLISAGTEVVIVEDEYRHVARARMKGVTTIYGDVLSEDTLDELPLENLGWVLGATDDDSYNSLVSIALGKDFGRERMLQVTDEETNEPHLRGQMPWGEAGRYEAINTRYWTGQRFKSCELTEDYTWERFRAERPDATPFFAIEKGRLMPLGDEAELEPGARVVYQG